MNAVGHQVAGILATNGIDFTGPDEDDTLFVRVNSALLQIDTEAGRTPWVGLRACVLTDLDLDAAAEERIVERLNDLNEQWLFPKFVLYPHRGVIGIEYDLFANALNADDFLTVAGQIGSMADDYDDEMQRAFGGSRAMDLADDAVVEALTDLDAPRPDGPGRDRRPRWRRLLPGGGG